jgi:hypothetical protein
MPIKKIKIKIDYALQKITSDANQKVNTNNADKELARNYCQQILSLIDNT